MDRSKRSVGPSVGRLVGPNGVDGLWIYGSNFQLCGIVLIRNYFYICTLHIPQVKCAIHHEFYARRKTHTETKQLLSNAISFFFFFLFLSSLKCYFIGVCVCVYAYDYGQRQVTMHCTHQKSQEFVDFFIPFALLFCRWTMFWIGSFNRPNIVCIHHKIIIRWTSWMSCMSTHCQGGTEYICIVHYNSWISLKSMSMLIRFWCGTRLRVYTHTHTHCESPHTIINRTTSLWF